jgi:hypothetical protein
MVADDSPAPGVVLLSFGIVETVVPVALVPLALPPVTAVVFGPATGVVLLSEGAGELTG